MRVREAVAIALQKLIRARSSETLGSLVSWINDEDWLAMRAVAAGVAEPVLMKGETPRKSLELHRKIIVKVAEGSDRKSEEFKILRKTLGYSLSVVTVGSPGEGFKCLRQLVGRKDPDLDWIVKENLKKDRLIRGFLREVTKLNELLS
ncbi:MAG: hypothetical protein OK422_02930 [Thaumarchaeota archaeon]|nr:hypothetical protein [Nitrososphaerota archaeon]